MEGSFIFLLQGSLHEDYLRSATSMLNIDSIHYNHLIYETVISDGYSEATGTNQTGYLPYFHKCLFLFFCLGTESSRY